ncbi:MAG: Na(+)/H(+) antiporter subunit D [bacterium]|nr:Na(+)/H(+) antiporter subunit D [bacterium]
MTDCLHPGLIFIFGAFLIPLVKGKTRAVYLLLLPLIAFLTLLHLPTGTSSLLSFLGYDLVLCRVDRLSIVFGHIFILMAFIGFLYSLHLKEYGQHIAASLYIGSSLGVIFSGDLITLFIFWEIMPFSALYLIWARKTRDSERAGFRYILVHIFGGLSLLLGIIITVGTTGTTAFEQLALTGIAGYLILTGFIINAAVPPFSAWLSDAYPEATVTGAVFLSAYTTKTAVYVLLRVFPGTELLVWLGAIMTLYGVVFAVLENDIRRLLAYHIISQVGYMVAGVGLGTALALNGSAAHAFCHILYKGLLFMGAGAVLHVTGKSKMTELGGLYKTMPITLVLYMIGGFSISAFPLFSGFVSKAMVVTASAENHLPLVWLLLTLASAGTFLSTSLKLPYFTWFGKDSGIRGKEPPLNMLIAMGITAFICILIGVEPVVLYNLLPFAVAYTPYTATHIVWTLQILLFTGLGFLFLVKGLAVKPYITLDTDWFYRKGAKGLAWLVNIPLSKAGEKINRAVFALIPSFLNWMSRNPIAVLKMAGDIVVLFFTASERKKEIKKRIRKEKDIYPGDIVKHWPIGTTVLWTMLFLVVYLLIYYLS